MGDTAEVVVDEAELQHFIMVNKLDERAAEALNTAAPAVQATVIKRGDLSDCRNASAAVLGRLRDARMSVNLSARSAEAGLSQPTVDVEGFIAAGNLDERAAESLRICSPKVQQVVISRGDLSDCRAPSSVVMSRIKDAQKGAHMSTGPVDPEALETFIMENALDERASDDLRTSSPSVQHQVMSMKLPADARNPSAIILGRIRDAKKNPTKVGNGGGRMGGGGGGGGGEGGEKMMAMMTGMMGMVQNMMASTAVASQGGATQQFLSNTTNCKWCQMGECWTHQQGGQQAQQIEMAGYGVDVESFIVGNELDQNAAMTLRSCTPDVQQTVMATASGNLTTVRNPSAVILARIKVAQMKKNVTGSLVNEQQQQQMQLQQQMQAEMHEQQMHEQQMQMTQHQQDQQMQAQAVEVTPQELYQFIVMNGLDERASEALQGCPPQMQRMVMDKGDLTTSRNASGSCMGRIRDARQAVAATASGGGQAAGMGGAGQAAGAGGMMDMMRNMMGMMETMYGGGTGAGGGAGAHGKAPATAKPQGAGTTWDGSMGDAAVAPGLEDFITENGIDQRAAQQLLACTVEVQEMIMQQGSLRDARNPSAALGGRIRAAGKGQVANMKKRNGPY